MSYWDVPTSLQETLFCPNHHIHGCARFCLSFLFSFLGSRLSFLATEPPDPRGVSEGFLNGVSERVSEGVSEGFLKGQPKDPSKPFKTPPSKPFKKVSKSMMRRASRGLKICSRVRGPVAGNESLDSRETKRRGDKWGARPKQNKRCCSQKLPDLCYSYESLFLDTFLSFFSCCLSLPAFLYFRGFLPKALSPCLI